LNEYLTLNLFIVLIIENESVRGTNVTTFYNVIAQDGADPWVFKHTDGWYYMTRTTGGDVRIWRSRTFTSIDAGDTRVAWTSPGSGPACASFWAPELHFFQSSW
jgi:GH43 family beta-xylosidase